MPSFSSYCENCDAKGPSFIEWLKFYGKSFIALLKKRIWLTVIITGVFVLAIALGI